MARKFLTPIDLSGLEIQNAVVQNLPTGSLPGSPASGRIAYDTTTNEFKVSISGVWTPLTTGASGATAVNNLDWKASVRAVADANGALATAFENGDTLDGVTLATGDRILLIAQTTATENGIYTVNATGAPTRATDAASSTQLTPGAKVFVESGSAYQFATFTYVSGAFTAQVWTINYNFSPTSFISGGASNSVRIVVPSNTSTFNSTGLGLLGRTAAAQIDLATGTTAALGIAFGANEFQLYRSAASTLNIGNGGAATALTIDPVTGTVTATLNLTARNAGAAVNTSLLVATTGVTTLNATSNIILKTTGSSNGVFVDSNTNSTPGRLQLTARDSGGAGVAGIITADVAGTMTFATGGGDFVFSSHKLTSVADPTSAQDAATKNYVDLAVQGLDPKASVLVATVGTETFTVAAGAVTQIAGTSVDGVSPAIGDRILIKDAPASTGVGSVNSSQPGNGIYTVTNNTTNLTVARATDMDVWTEVPGAYTWVERGTSNNSDSAFISTADQGGTINTTAIKFVKFANATASQSAYYSALGSGTATSFSITQATHQLRASRGIVAQIQEESTGNVVDADISIASNGDATFTFATSQTLSGFRFTLIG